MEVTKLRSIRQREGDRLQTDRNTGCLPEGGVAVP